MFGTERNEFNNKTRCYQFNSKTRQRPLNHWQLETINRSIITLLNVDYTILALIYVTRLKSGLSNIIAESQTGFMAKRHISSNIRLVLDVLDYNHFVHSDALICFLTFIRRLTQLITTFYYRVYIHLVLEIISFRQLKCFIEALIVP